MIIVLNANNNLLPQYVMTNEQDMLKHALQQFKKIPLKEERGPQERLHLKSLHSRIELGDGFQDMFFLQSFLQPIQKWVDKRLTDYHTHFAEVCRLLVAVGKYWIYSFAKYFSYYMEEFVFSYISTYLAIFFSYIFTSLLALSFLHHIY